MYIPTFSKDQLEVESVGTLQTDTFYLKNILPLSRIRQILRQSRAARSQAAVQ